MFAEIIETERLLLRPFTMADVNGSYQLNLDAEVTKYTNDGGGVSYEEIKKRIHGVVHGDYEKYGFGRFAVIYKDTNEFVGFSGLKYLSEYDEVDIGYRFNQKYWGKGIATESAHASLEFGFQKLKLEKIVGYAMPENMASVRVMEKLGFEFEKDYLEEGVLVRKYYIDAASFRIP